MRDIDLLALHGIGDFLLQTDEEGRNKINDPNLRLKHVQKYQNVFVLPVLWMWWKGDTTFWRGFIFLYLLALLHYITDSKRWVSGDKWPPKPIIADQFLHIIQLALLRRIL